MIDHAGAIHLHSAYSFDGRTPIADILAAARKNGLDFLVLTDHATLRAKEEGFEGWHDGVLLIVGEEIAPRFNHFLAFGLSETVSTLQDPPDLPPQDYIDRVRGLGGIGFIAHPDHEGAALFHVKHYPWTDWTATGYTGIGIWDFMTDWQNSLSGYLQAILSYAFPALFLRGPSPRTLERWDRLAQERRVVGIGELDNHNSRMRFWGIDVPVFPFDRVFGLIRTHVLTASPLSGNSQADVATLLCALKKGRAYVSLDYFRPATGFSLTLRKKGRSATMGDKFSLERSADITIHVPRRAHILLLRNGLLFRETTGTDLAAAIVAPGVYRVEVYLKVLGRKRPWIFSNPIYVTAADTSISADPPVET
jgi:hypothetical protein